MNLHLRKTQLSLLIVLTAVTMMIGLLRATSLLAAGDAPGVAAPPISFTITKSVLGAAPGSEWQFSGTGQIGAFNLPTAGGSKAVSITAGVKYTLTEVVKAGYVLSDVVCSGVQATLTANGDGVVFTVPGANQGSPNNGTPPGCTFVNAQLANVTVTKKSIPPTDRVFYFISPQHQFQLVDDGLGVSNTKTLANVIPGDFTLAEKFGHPGWDTVSRCEYEAGGVVVGDTSVDLNMLPGASAICTFTNTMNTITVIKEASPESSQNFFFSWSSQPPPAAANAAGGQLPFGSFQLVDDGTDLTNSYVITEAHANLEYTIEEDVPLGWELSGLTCVDGEGAPAGVVSVNNAQAVINVEPGGQYTCTFNNRGPSIVLTKTVGLAPAACATTQELTVLAGTSVTYCFTVRNTGPITLSLHTLKDSVLGQLLTDFSKDLAPSASVVVTQAHTATVSATNIATWTASLGGVCSAAADCANGVAPLLTATATDTAKVTVLPRTYQIELTKTVGLNPGQCATTDELTVVSGAKVVYCFKVKNTGSSSLSLHSLKDSVLGALLTNFAYDLAPNATVAITKVHTATVSATNVATWTASFGGNVAVDSDSAKVIVTPRQPQIELRKTVSVDSGVCATTATITVPTGTTVYYCYTVKNTGNVTLPLHTLVDNKLGNLLVNFPFDLGPGTSVSTVQAGKTISAVITTSTDNTGTWAAAVPGGGSVSASASARVVVGKAAITVNKTVGKSATGCAPTAQISVQQGEQVYFCVIIENTGDFTLTHHVVDDPLLNLKLTVPLALAPKAKAVITRDQVPQLGPITVEQPITNTVTITSSTAAPPSAAGLPQVEASPNVVIASAKSVGTAVVKIALPTAIEESPEPDAVLSKRMYLPVITR